VDKVSISEKLAQITAHWDPKVIAELNGQHVKLAKLQGEFVWHHHDDEDEMFLVLAGELSMEFRDRKVRVGAGEFIVVPRGVEHRPVCERETHIMLFEPAGTLNTGNVTNERTVEKPERI